MGKVLIYRKACIAENRAEDVHACAACDHLAGFLLIGATSTSAQQAGIERKMLLQKEGASRLSDDRQRLGVLRQVHVR